jgi:hypothetical protein
MQVRNELIFEEKQYMGHNRLSIVIRTLLTLFCFAGYYWSQNPKSIQVLFMSLGAYPMEDLVYSGEIFFIIGCVILLLSAGLTFVLHIRTRVYRGYMMVDGFWTSRVVKIDLSNIVHIRRGRYKRNSFRRATYNLHNNGIIRFYTSGNEFIELTDNTGYVYRIGSQKSRELWQILKTETDSNKG